ncbi:MAG: pantetheine-phosphate adenylyltransferase [Gammaproteobacteria bacterium]
MSTTVVYPGTFDPVTLGHIDIIERASHMFDQVIVAVAKRPEKETLFEFDERVDLVKDCLEGKDKIKVEGFSELLTDFLKHHRTHTIIRGVRAYSDFEYEVQLASMYRRLMPNIECVYLLPSEKNMNVSSSLVREVARLNGDVSSCVPDFVAQALQAKVHENMN